MLVFAQPVGSGLVDTTPSGRLCCAGQTGLVCSLSGKNPKSCFRSGLKTAGLQPGGLVTSSCLSLGVLLPHSTSSSRCHSEGRASLRQASKAVQRPQPMPGWRPSICRLLLRAKGKGFGFNPWSLSPPVPSMHLPARFCSSSPELSQPVLEEMHRSYMANSFRNCAALFGPFAPVQPFVAEWSLARIRGWLLRPWYYALRRTNPNQSFTPCSKRCSKCFGPSVYYCSFLFSCWGTP